jgi:radical SAM protein with 4Fe4S-binding SPASM domain
MGNELQLFSHRLAWLRFSINSGIETNYKKIHGCDHLHRVSKTLQQACKQKGLTVGVQCLLLDQSYADLFQLLQMCETAGATYVAFKPYSRHPQSKHEMPTIRADKYVDEAITDFRRSSDSQMEVAIRKELPPKDYTGCLAAVRAFWLIVANGEVYPCAQFVGKQEWCIGNINFQTYKEIRESEKAREVRDRLADLDCSTCRHPCRCDAANR